MVTSSGCLHQLPGVCFSSKGKLGEGAGIGVVGVLSLLRQPPPRPPVENSCIFFNLVYGLKSYQFENEEGVPLRIPAEMEGWE